MENMKMQLHLFGVVNKKALVAMQDRKEGANKNGERQPSRYNW
jgi:hypothetical protein